MFKVKIILVTYKTRTISATKNMMQSEEKSKFVEWNQNSWKLHAKALYDIFMIYNIDLQYTKSQVLFKIHIIFMSVS